MELVGPCGIVAQPHAEIGGRHFVVVVGIDVAEIEAVDLLVLASAGKRPCRYRGASASAPGRNAIQSSISRWAWAIRPAATGPAPGGGEGESMCHDCGAWTSGSSASSAWSKVVPVRGRPMTKIGRSIWTCGNGRNGLAVEREAQAVGQHALHLPADADELVRRIGSGAIGPVDDLAEPRLQPGIGKAICPGLALGEGEDFVGDEQSGLFIGLSTLRTARPCARAKSGRPAQRKWRAVSMAI